MSTDFSGYKFYALSYFTTTGEIVDEIPLAGLPTFSQQIDDNGSWTIAAQLGDGRNGTVNKSHLRGMTNKWRHSVALCWGTGNRPQDYIIQAGPVVSRALQSTAGGQPPIMQIGGLGFWGLLNKIMQIAATWSGVSVGQAGGADTTFTSSLQGIAVDILTNAAGPSGRQPLPIDLPLAIAGTNVRNYFGYDLTSSGQRLMELTQVINGPDVLPKPYFFDGNHIHHNMLIGNPLLATSGFPLKFDYPGNTVEILTNEDGSDQSTTTMEKGNGIEYDTLFASSVDTDLIDAGWPLLEEADITHGDVVEQTTLQSWADSTQALNRAGVDTWTVRARMDDQDYPFGSFDPGCPISYNVQNHNWLEDGNYTQRLIGITQGTVDFEYKQLVQVTQEDPD